MSPLLEIANKLLGGDKSPTESKRGAIASIFSLTNSLEFNPPNQEEYEEFLFLVHDIIAKGDSGKRSIIYRAIRCSMQNEEFAIALVDTEIHWLIVTSLEREGESYNIERMQALKIVRKFLAIIPLEFPVAFARSLVAIVNFKDDPFRKFCMETLREVAVTNPELAATVNAFNPLLEAVVEPITEELAENIMLTILCLLNNPHTRRIIRPNLDMLTLLAPFLDLDGEAEELSTKWNSAKAAVVIMMRSWVGIAHLCGEDPGLPLLVSMLQDPKVPAATQDIILETISEVLAPVSSKVTLSTKHRHQQVWASVKSRAVSATAPSPSLERNTARGSFAKGGNIFSRAITHAGPLFLSKGGSLDDAVASGNSTGIGTAGRRDLRETFAGSSGAAMVAQDPGNAAEALITPPADRRTVATSKPMHRSGFSFSLMPEERASFVSGQDSNTTGATGAGVGARKGAVGRGDRGGPQTKSVVGDAASKSESGSGKLRPPSATVSAVSGNRGSVSGGQAKGQGTSTLPPTTRGSFSIASFFNPRRSSATYGHNPAATATLPGGGAMNSTTGSGSSGSGAGGSADGSTAAAGLGGNNNIINKKKGLSLIAAGKSGTRAAARAMGGGGGSVAGGGAGAEFRQTHSAANSSGGSLSDIEVARADSFCAFSSIGGGGSTPILFSGEDISSGNGSSVESNFDLIYNMMDNYTALLCCAFLHADLIPSLYFLGIHGTFSLATKSRKLLVDFLRTLANIFPESKCSELLTMPSLLDFAASVQGGVGMNNSRAHKSSLILISLADAFSVMPYKQVSGSHISGLSLHPNFASSAVRVRSPSFTPSVGGGSVGGSAAAVASAQLGGVSSSGHHHHHHHQGMISANNSTIVIGSSRFPPLNLETIFELAEEIKISSMSNISGATADISSGIEMTGATVDLIRNMRLSITPAIEKHDFLKQMDLSKVNGNQGKEPFRWDWLMISDMLEYSFQNPDRLSEALKTKWIRRVSGFYRCSVDEKAFFANLDWYPTHLQFLECACNLYSVLLRDETGRAFLNMDRRGMLFTEMANEIENLTQYASSGSMLGGYPSAGSLPGGTATGTGAVGGGAVGAGGGGYGGHGVSGVVLANGALSNFGHAGSGGGGGILNSSAHAAAVGGRGGGSHGAYPGGVAAQTSSGNLNNPGGTGTGSNAAAASGVGGAGGTGAGGPTGGGLGLEVLGGVGYPRSVFRMYSCNATMAREYFTLLGRVVKSSNSRRLLDGTNIFLHLSKIGAHTSLNYLTRLVFTSLCFTDEGVMSRHLLQLWTTNSDCADDLREYFHSVLRVLQQSFSSGSSGARDLESNWCVESIVNQLTLEDQPSEMICKALEEAAHNKSYLRAIIARKPRALFEPRMESLLIRFLAVPEGIAFLSQNDWLSTTLNEWKSHRCSAYAKLVEDRVSQVFQDNAQLGTYPSTASGQLAKYVAREKRAVSNASSIGGFGGVGGGLEFNTSGRDRSGTGNTAGGGGGSDSVRGGGASDDNSNAESNASNMKSSKMLSKGVEPIPIYTPEFSSAMSAGATAGSFSSSHRGQSASGGVSSSGVGTAPTGLTSDPNSGLSVDLQGLMRVPWHMEVKVSSQHSARQSISIAGVEYLKIDSYLDISEMSSPHCFETTSDDCRIIKVKGILLDNKGKPHGHPIAANRIVSSTLLSGICPIFRNGRVQSNLSELRPAVTRVRRASTAGQRTPNANALTGSGEDSGGTVGVSGLAVGGGGGGASGTAGGSSNSAGGGVGGGAGAGSSGAGGLGGAAMVDIGGGASIPRSQMVNNPLMNSDLLNNVNENGDAPITSQSGAEQLYDWCTCRPGHRQGNVIELDDSKFCVVIPGDPAVWIFSRRSPIVTRARKLSIQSNGSGKNINGSSMKSTSNDGIINRGARQMSLGNLDESPFAAHSSYRSSNRSDTSRAGSLVYLLEVHYYFKLRTGQPIFVPMPRHIYGELSRTLEGCEQLARRHIVFELVETAHRAVTSAQSFLLMAEKERARRRSGAGAAVRGKGLGGAVGGLGGLGFAGLAGSKDLAAAKRKLGAPAMRGIAEEEPSTPDSKSSTETGFFASSAAGLSEDVRKNDDVLRGALWSLGNIGCTDYGYAEIAKIDPTFVEWCIENVTSYPNYSMRATFFYVLGLLSRTARGGRRLRKANWDFSPVGTNSAVALPFNPAELFRSSAAAAAAASLDSGRTSSPSGEESTRSRGYSSGRMRSESAESDTYNGGAQSVTPSSEDRAVASMDINSNRSIAAAFDMERSAAVRKVDLIIGMGQAAGVGGRGMGSGVLPAFGRGKESPSSITVHPPAATRTLTPFLQPGSISEQMEVLNLISKLPGVILYRDCKKKLEELKDKNPDLFSNRSLYLEVHRLLESYTFKLVARREILGMFTVNARMKHAPVGCEGGVGVGQLGGSGTIFGRSLGRISSSEDLTSVSSAGSGGSPPRINNNNAGNNNNIPSLNGENKPVDGTAKTSSGTVPGGRLSIMTPAQAGAQRSNGRARNTGRAY